MASILLPLLDLTPSNLWRWECGRWRRSFCPNPSSPVLLLFGDRRGERSVGRTLAPLPPAMTFTLEWQDPSDHLVMTPLGLTPRDLEPPRLPGSGAGWTSPLSHLSESRGSRIVLFPFGPPNLPASRERCAELVVWAGGDPARMLDHNPGSLERFLDQTSRVRAVRERTDGAMVVLTQTNPLVLSVVVARRRIEAAIPTLRDALWILFVDPDLDPFFEPEARRMGDLDGQMDDAPLWIGPSGRSYLVLTPGVEDVRHLRTRSLEYFLRPRY